MFPYYTRFRKSSTAFVVTLAAGLAAAGCGSTSASAPASSSAGSTATSSSGSGHVDPATATGTIYLLTPNVTTPAWPTYYIPEEEAGIKSIFPHVKIAILDGNNSQATQLSQAQAAIAKHALGVVLTPVVPTEAGAELAQLAAAKIPTVAYLHDPDGGPVFAYVWVNFQTVGSWFGNYVEQHLSQLGKSPVRVALIYGDPTFAVYTDYLRGMNPILTSLIHEGKVKVVCKADSTAWLPANAQTAMQQCLTKNGNNVDAVISMNDSTDDGIWAALKAAGLNGKIPIIGGHDASLTGVQRVLAGQQVATFDFDAQAAGLATAKLLAADMEGKTAASTGLINFQFDNSYVKGGVPTYKASEHAVTPATVDPLVIETHIWTKKQLCTGIAATSSFCNG